MSRRPGWLSSRVRHATTCAALLAAGLTACSDGATAPTLAPPAAAVARARSADDTRGVLFGPHTFRRATGEPVAEAVTVGGANLSSFEGPFELTLQSGDNGPSSRATAAWVSLDGVLLYGPSDFSPRVTTLTRTVTLRAGSVLEVRMAGAPGSTLTATITGVPVGGGSGPVGPDGGQVGVDGLATVAFPAGFFASARTVEVSRASDAPSMAQFDDLASLFRVSGRTDHLVRVLAGPSAPVGDTFTATLTVPAGLVIPAGHRPELFARFHEDAGAAVLDNFQLVESSYDPATRTITATVLADAFTDTRRTDGQFEALFLIATTPGGAIAPTSGANAALSRMITAMATAGSSCKAANIGRPVPDNVPVTSPYGQRTHPVTGQKGKMHWGTDFGAPTGTRVSAASDGVVERVWLSATYGQTMILRHTDGSATLYAHLETTGRTVGARVQRGDPIATTDGARGAPTAGTSTGPHLHFEYVPNGQIVQSKSRIDPEPCIRDENASGSLTVRDNGNLADDAFEVYLDGTLVGRTAIGASNTIGLNNLRVGTHQIRLVGIVVPDDVGTYEIIVSDGITFAGGATSVSGIVPLGGSATYSIDVPDPSAGRTVARLAAEPTAPRATEHNAVHEGPQ